MKQHLPDPLSRKDLQKLTRERLVFTARAIFARDGYHGAKLDEIAAEAGFSKGAIYSNFDGKAGLFLAVMDTNIQTALDSPEVMEETSLAGLTEDGDYDQAVHGFGLATLEFVAMAARDPQLREETATRLDRIAHTYAMVADAVGAKNGNLTPQEMGALVFALDQGAAVLSLAGSSSVDDRLVSRGMAALFGLKRNDGDAPLLPQEIMRRVVREEYEGRNEH